MGRTGICKYCRHYKTKTLDGRIVSEYCSECDDGSYGYIECDWFSKKLIVRIKELLGGL